MRRRALAVLGAGLVALGGWQAASGAAGPAKALIGQWLLDAAWERTRASGRPARPWGWADVAPVARIAAPRIGASAVVLGDASGEAMAWGPGHVPGTAAPGAPGLSAIAGHRDSHLAFLADLRPGDRLVLETAGGRVDYRVSHGVVVDSRAWRLPTTQAGVPRLALVTCWPFDGAFDGPLRFVLYAEPVPAAA